MADVLSVTSLNMYVKSILESDNILFDIAVEGEISNFKKYPSSGHCYFSLKDEKSTIKAVMFSSYTRNLTFIPEDGMKVIVRGRVSLYERDGVYQIYVTNMFVNGAGQYRVAFEMLKNKLEKEGLFDARHKKVLPNYPFKIGVATSGSGAAFLDIVSVAQRRFPCVQIVLAPCQVQGLQAADSIIAAVQALDNIEDIDVIIVGRGGGSREDLWVFNDEKIARAVYACKKPVISAVGHEIDYSILDFVRDVRAATPTAAAELALPDINNINMRLVNMDKSIISSMNQLISGGVRKIALIEKSDGFLSAKNNIKQNLDKIAVMQKDMRDMLGKRIDIFKHDISAKTDLLESLSPINNLKRGYGLIYDKNNTVKCSDFTVGEPLKLVTYTQKIECEVTNVELRKD